MFLGDFELSETREWDFKCLPQKVVCTHVDPNRIQKYHRYMLLKYTPINNSITVFRLRITFQNPKFCQHQNFRLIVLTLNFNIIILQKFVSDSTEGVIFPRKTTFNLKMYDKNDTKNQPIRSQGTLSLPPKNLTVF